MKKYNDFLLENQDNVFQYGDRVSLKNKTGTIIGFNGRHNQSYLVEFDNGTSYTHDGNGVMDIWSHKIIGNTDKRINGNYYWVYGNELKLISRVQPENTDQFEDWEDINEHNKLKFKVGDRVFFTGMVYNNKIKDNIYVKEEPSTVVSVDVFDPLLPYLLKFDNKEIGVYNTEIGDNGGHWVSKKFLIPIEHEETDQFEDWEDINEDNEYEFKVGDRVIHTECPNTNCEYNGKKGTITNLYFCSDKNILFTVTMDDYIESIYLKKYQLKLIEPENTDQFEDWEDVNENTDYDFQIGDVVKVINHGYKDFLYNAIGVVIDKIYDCGGLNWYIVEFNDKETKDILIRYANENKSMWYDCLINFFDKRKAEGKEYNIYMFTIEDLESYEDKHEDQFEDWEDINEEYKYTFKEGDRVIIIQCTDNNKNNIIGEVGTIVYTIGGKLYDVKLDKNIHISDNRGNYDNCWSAFSNEIELYQEPEDQFEDWEDINESNEYEFKAGDKVKYVRCDHPSTCMNLHSYALSQLVLGNIYTVDIRQDNNDDDTSIFLDNPRGDGYRYYASCQFKLVEPEPEDQFEDWEDIDESNDYEFKIGDRVKLIYMPSGYYNYTATISNIKATSARGKIIYLDIDGGINNYAYCYMEGASKHLQLISPYEPEDQFEDWEDIDESNEYNKEDFIPIKSLDEIKVGDIVWTKNNWGTPDKASEVISINKDIIYVVGSGAWDNPNYIMLYSPKTDPEDQFEDWEDINESINIGDIVEINDVYGFTEIEHYTGTVIDTINNCGGHNWYVVEFNDESDEDIKDKLITYVNNNIESWHKCLRDYFYKRETEGKEYNIYMFTEKQLNFISSSEPEDQFEDWEDI